MGNLSHLELKGNIVNSTIVFKLIYRFNAIPIWVPNLTSLQKLKSCLWNVYGIAADPKWLTTAQRARLAVSDSVALWTVTCQAPLSFGFSRQEYWSISHFLHQGIFLNQGSNLSPLRCRPILYPLNHQGSSIWLKQSSKRKNKLGGHALWDFKLY